MKMTVKRRLWMGFAANLLVLPCFFAVALWSMAGAEEGVALEHESVEQIRAAEALIAQLQTLPSNPSSSQQRTLREEVDRLREASSRSVLRSEVEALARQLGDFPLTISAAVGPGQHGATISELRQLVDAGWREFDERQKVMGEVKQRTLGVMSLLVPLMVVGAIFASVMVSRTILGPLDQLTAAAGRIANGDMRESVALPSDEELRVLATSFNQMRTRLSGTLQRMRSYTEEVSQTATSVLAATTQMTDGVQQQSSATEETSSAMEEIAAQIQGVSRNAVELAEDSGAAAQGSRQIGAGADAVLKAARELHSALDRGGKMIEQVAATARGGANSAGELQQFAQQIDTEAAEGGGALDLTVSRLERVGEATRSSTQAIEALGARSREITRIVETMGDIADQTNLLALNAAIEAARAGDMGRGFAVVAEEVRKLAERSVAAAKEVGEMVGNLRNEMDGTLRLARDNATQTAEGVQLLGETGKRMRRMVDSVRRIKELVSRLTGAMGDQSRSASELEQEVGSLRGLSSTLSRNAADQAQTAAGVVGAVDRMSSRTRQVADATVQVRAGGDQVVKAVENISVVARQNQDAVHRVAGSMQALAGKVAELQQQTQSILLEDRV